MKQVVQFLLPGGTEERTWSLRDPWLSLSTNKYESHLNPFPVLHSRNI